MSRFVLVNNKPSNQLPSLIYPNVGRANKFLIKLISTSAQRAIETEIKGFNEQLPDACYVNKFPGEHYRLINSIIKVTEARNVVEIGTWTGMGTVAILHDNPNTNLATFDIIPWNKLGVPSHLSEDFLNLNENSRQIISDLSDPKQFQLHFDVLDEADIIFLDGPKNGIFEYEFVQLLTSLSMRKNKILIVDDIKFLNMIDFWQHICSPKLDASSFGHWSGTGIIDISGILKLQDC